MINYCKILLLSLYTLSFLNAQNNPKNFKMIELDTKNKSELVKIALNTIKEKYPTITINKADYKTTAFKNSKEVIITFERIVKFISEQDKNKKIAYDINVNLASKQCIPFDDSFFGELYKPSEYDLKAFAFVKKHFGNLSSEFTHTISETEEEYTIERTNEYSFGSYILSKKTGEVISKLETSYLPSPKPDFPDEDPLIEVLE